MGANETAACRHLCACSEKATSGPGGNSMVNIGSPRSTPSQLPREPGVGYPRSATAGQPQAPETRSAHAAAGPSGLMQANGACTAMMAVGDSRSTSSANARDSGSDSGALPGSYPGPCSLVKFRDGQFRFRSTSRAEFLVPADKPSGFNAGTTRTRGNPAGGTDIQLPTKATIASVLVGSSPWTPPMSRTQPPSCRPNRPTGIGRPKVE